MEHIMAVPASENGRTIMLLIYRYDILKDSFSMRASDKMHNCLREMETELANMKDLAKRQPPPAPVQQFTPTIVQQVTPSQQPSSSAGVAPGPPVSVPAARTVFDLDTKLPEAPTPLMRFHVATVVTEISRRRWQMHSESAATTRCRFVCPFGDSCKNKDVEMNGRKCNNVHLKSGEEKEPKVIDTMLICENLRKDKPEVKTFRDLADELMRAFEATA